MITLKFSFLVISLKKYFFTILFFIFLISLILFSSSNIQAAKNGLILWAEAVVPSLFPFFIASDLLCKTNLISICGRYLGKFMRPLFNLPGEAIIAIIIGTISGYPVGAKIVCQLENSHKLSKEEAERLVAFSNNSGPLFILGTVGITLFANRTIGILLLTSHIIASISVGILYRFWSPKTQNKLNSNLKTINISNNSSNISTSISFRNLGESIGNSIKNSIQSILLVGGFIVLFSVILSIFKNSGIFSYLTSIDSFINLPMYFSESFASGLLELTNGIKAISELSFENISLKIVSASFLLGFGGISILLQVFSIISKNHLSIKPYFIGKIFQAIFSSIYTYLFLLFL